MSEGKQTEVLIAYYSRRGDQLVNGVIRTLRTGNTEMAAGFLQKITGAKVFRIIPEKEYPKEYCRCIDLARQDLLHHARPALKKYLDTIEPFTTILLGYPNYWGTMPAPVFSFLEAYDFAGKTIYPFCTYEDTEFGHSLKDLKKVCPDAQIGQGLAMRGANIQNEIHRMRSWVQNMQ